MNIHPFRICNVLLGCTVHEGVWAWGCKWRLKATLSTCFCPSVGLPASLRKRLTKMVTNWSSLKGPARESCHFVIYSLEVTCNLLLWGLGGRTSVVEGRKLGMGGVSTSCEPGCRLFRCRTHFTYLFVFLLSSSRAHFKSIPSFEAQLTQILSCQQSLNHSH